MTIKILPADDHTNMREGLRSLIEKRTGMEVVAEAKNGRRAVKLARQRRPDVVVMDINMPGMNGIDAAYQILSDSPNVKLIALSVYSDRQFVAGMLKMGALGYLLKNRAFEELARAILTVANNQTYLSSKIPCMIIKEDIKKSA